MAILGSLSTSIVIYQIFDHVLRQNFEYRWAYSSTLFSNKSGSIFYSMKVKSSRIAICTHKDKIM